MENKNFFQEKYVKVEEILRVNKKEYLLKCASCEKKLIKIHTPPDIPGKIKIKCKCPYCDDFSFLTEIEVKYFIEPINLSVTDITDGIIYVSKIC
jgi:hypothetical protein